MTTLVMILIGLIALLYYWYGGKRY